MSAVTILTWAQICIRRFKWKPSRSRMKLPDHLASAPTLAFRLGVLVTVSTRLIKSIWCQCWTRDNSEKSTPSLAGHRWTSVIGQDMFFSGLLSQKWSQACKRPTIWALFFFSRHRIYITAGFFYVLRSGRGIDCFKRCVGGKNPFFRSVET